MSNYFHSAGRLALGGLFFLLLFSTNPANAQDISGGAVPVETYWQQVEEALKIIRELDGAGGDAIQSALGSQAAEFKMITGVVLSDGRQVPLDNGYLITSFQDTAPDMIRLEAYLTAVLESRDRWPGANHDSQDLIPLSEILALPEFQSIQEEPGPIQRIWNWIVEQFLGFLARIYPQSAGGLGPLVRIVLTAAGLIALIAALVFAVRGFLAGIVADEAGFARDNGGFSLISADQALEQAQSFSNTGDYRSAVRYLYISSLLLLEERELLRYDRTRTNQEYLRSVAGKPELVAVLREVIDMFDRVWYGFQSLDAHGYSHYARQVEKLRQQR